MCDKVPYENYKLAKDALKKVASREKQGFRVYKCEECFKFHLTSIKPRKKPCSPKGLEQLNHDAEIIKLKKLIENGKLKKMPAKRPKQKNVPGQATFKLGDLYPNMKNINNP